MSFVMTITCRSGLETFCVHVLVWSCTRWRSQGQSEMLVCLTFIDHWDSPFSLSKYNTFTHTRTHCVTSLGGHGRNLDSGKWWTYLLREVSLENILISNRLIWITLERLGTIHKSLQQTFSKILKTSVLGSKETGSQKKGEEGPITLNLTVFTLH